MKKLLRLTVAALLLATSQVSTAQIKMAPNYFRADPAVYKYRMAKVVEWKDTEDEQITQYVYDKMGCLVKEGSYDICIQLHLRPARLYDSERRRSFKN